MVDAFGFKIPICAENGGLDAFSRVVQLLFLNCKDQFKLSIQLRTEIRLMITDKPHPTEASINKAHYN